MKKYYFYKCDLPLNSLSLWELKDSYFYSYFTPDYIIHSHNLLIYKHIQKSVRVSFSAPNASQQCGAFLLCPGWFSLLGPCTSLACTGNQDRTTIPCTSLADLADS